MAIKLPMDQDFVNNITAEELGALQARNCEKVLKTMNQEQRLRMLIEVENTIYRMEAALDEPFVPVADKHMFRCTNPYTEMKKYSHIYTILAGWLTKEDLEMRASIGKAVWEAKLEEIDLAKINIKAGDLVRICHGPFENFLGGVKAVNASTGKVAVVVEMFERELVITLYANQLAKLGDSVVTVG